MNEYLSNHPIIAGIMLIVVGLGFLIFTCYKSRYDEDAFDSSMSFKGIVIGVVFILFGILYVMGF